VSAPLASDRPGLFEALDADNPARSMQTDQIREGSQISMPDKVHGRQDFQRVKRRSNAPGRFRSSRSHDCERSDQGEERRGVDGSAKALGENSRPVVET